MVGQEIRDLEYHERCRATAKSMGLTLSGSSWNAGFSTNENKDVSHAAMEAIEARDARIHDLEAEVEKLKKAIFTAMELLGRGRTESLNRR